MKYLLKRTLAYVFDGMLCYTVIMLVIQWAILSNIRGSIGVTDEWFENSWNMQIYVLLSISLPVWFYFTYFDSNRAKGTPGKRIMNLSVQNWNGCKIGLLRSFRRTFLKLLPWEILHTGIIFPTPVYFENNPEIRPLSIFGLLLFMLYFLSILVSSENYAIYDRIIRTRVVEKD